MPRIVRVVLVTTFLGLLYDGVHGRGDIQFRISAPELQKGTSVLLVPRNEYRFNESKSKVQGVTNDFSYELTNLNELPSIPVSDVQIPGDGRLLITTHSYKLKQTGNLKISRLSNVDDVIYDGPIDVSLLNVTLMSLLFIDNSSQLWTSSTLLALDFSNCSSDIEDISVNEKTMQNIGIHLSTATLKDILRKSICQSYNGYYSFVFEESDIRFKLFEKEIVVATETTYVEIKNDYVIISQKIKAETKEGNLPYPTDDHMVPFPLPDSSSHPFEIILNPTVLNDLFLEFKKEIGIGVQDLPIGQLLPNLKDLSELDTQGIYISLLFPMVGKKFPDSVATMIVSDADIYFTVKDGSIEIHFDINATLSVTLNCDKSRTFNALNLSMNLVFPAQIGFDNKYITMNLLTFGGNFTILDSNVGHIMDRGLRSLLYSAPYYLSNSLHKLNDMFQGIPLQDILPKNIFAEVDQISVKGNYFIAGGNLSLTDPNLPRIKREQIQWAGKPAKKGLLLLGIDNTPENPEGFVLKEENCKKEVRSSASHHLHQSASLLLILLVVFITGAQQITYLF